MTVLVFDLEEYTIFFTAGIGDDAVGTGVDGSVVPQADAEETL